MKFLKTIGGIWRRRPSKATLIAKCNLLGAALHEVVMKLIEVTDELKMSDDLLTDAAERAQRLERYLRDAQQVIAAVNSPNGTTRKLGRLVDEALAGTEAKTLAEMTQ